MSPGIRAEVTIDARAVCPVARVSKAAGARTDSVRWARTTDETVTEEFALRDGTPDDHDVEEVFGTDSKTVYRFERSDDECPCATVERLGRPIDEVFAESGSLHVVFHVDGVERLRETIDELRTHYEGVDVRRLVRSGSDDEATDLVFVDRGILTDRQREVLETAHDMGYFDHPKGANAGDVADELGISTSTFTEHLAAAQGKLFSVVLDQ